MAVLAAVLVACSALATPASAGTTAPTVSGLSKHRDAYWGGNRITVYGTNFNNVQNVYFGQSPGSWIEVESPTTLTVVEPWHALGIFHVRVATASGQSVRTSADEFTFTPPTMDTPIQGGYTARQEQHISAQVRAEHHNVALAPAAGHWTAAMGLTAMRRARSWLGLPYSWDGGTFTSPTLGQCVANGGDLDCHVDGFDCSGLTLYSWGPYEHLVHYAATQHRTAGKFHPTIGELVPGDLLFFGYSPGSIDHTVIYAGNGDVFQAPESGHLIEKTPLSEMITGDGTYRGATRPMSAGQQSSGPILSTMTSQLPLTGGTVTITGRWLYNATEVSVGSTRVYNFAHPVSNKIVVPVPAHNAGTVNVTVNNPWGSVTQPLVFAAPPQLTSLSPTEGPTAGGNVVTLTGTNLANLTQVTVDSVKVPFTAVSNTQVTITMPSHVAGTVPVVATTPSGSSNQVSYMFVDTSLLIPGTGTYAYTMRAA